MPDHTHENDTVKNASRSVWGLSPAGTTYGNSHEPGTREFFDAVLKKRFSEETPWMDEIVNFQRFKGKQVLEIGSGCGYDAYQFCKHGAIYTGIDITPENKIRATRHLASHGYSATILEMDAENMSFDHKFDYVFSFGVLHHTPNIEKVFRDVHALLSDDGEFQVIVYHKNSIFYRIYLTLYWWILKGEWRYKTLAQRLAEIEHTTADTLPLVKVYSKKELKKILHTAGFTVIKTDVRHFTAATIPPIRFLWRYYSHIPLWLMTAIGKRFGWYLSMRAVKTRKESQ